MRNRKMVLWVDLEVGRDDLLTEDRSRVLEEPGLVHRSLWIGLWEYGDVDPQQRVAGADVRVQLLVARWRGGSGNLHHDTSGSGLSGSFRTVDPGAHAVKRGSGAGAPSDGGTLIPL